MLSGPDIRAARRHLKLNQGEAAQLWRVHSRTWQRWETGELAMPGSADLLLRACIDFPPLLQWIREREEEDLNNG